MSLFDMDMKYADVVDVEEAFAYLERRPFRVRGRSAGRRSRAGAARHTDCARVPDPPPPRPRAPVLRPRQRTHARRETSMLIKAAGSGLEEVAAADVVAVELADGRTTSGALMPDELPLHREIYRARPDVGGVVHTHPQASVAVSLHAGRWAVACQDAVPFWNRIAFYEAAELVSTPEAGRGLAAALGDGEPCSCAATAS